MRGVCLTVALLASATAFENAAMRRRNKARREMVSFLNVPGFSEAETSCAACEAVARSVEDTMRLNKHKEGDVVRLGLLMEACNGIEGQLPMKMPPIEKGGPEVLHFYGSQESLDKLMKSDKGYDLSKTGLSEFCDAFVEEFEEELVNVMDTAKPATEALETPKGVAIPRFELKVDICVKATNMCDDEMLNRLSYHRIAQADPALMKDKMGELYDMLKAKGLTKDAEQKKDAGQKSKTIGQGGDQAPKVRPSGVDKATKPPKAESGNRAKNMNKQGRAAPKSQHSEARPTLLGILDGAVRKLISASVYVQVGVLVFTVLAIYIGGQVARIW